MRAVASRFAILAVLAITSACALKVDPLTFPVGSAGSTLYVVIEGTMATVHAFQFEDSAPVEMSAPHPEGTAALYVLKYSCPLDCLGLEPGKQVVSAMGQTLPAPKTVLAADYREGKSSGWQMLDAMPDVLVGLHLDVPNPIAACTSFSHQTVMASSGRIATLLLPLDGDDGEEVLVGDVRDLFRVTRAGAIPLSADDPRYAAARGVIAGFREPMTGKLWMIKANGELFSGSVEAGFTQVADVPLPEEPRLVWMHGADDGSELYFATARRSLSQYKNGVARELYAGDPEVIDEGGGVVWLSPGKAIAIGLPPDEIVHVNNDAVSTEHLPNADRLQSIGSAGEFGPVLGDWRGSLFLRRASDRFESLRSEEAYRTQVKVITALAGRLYYGGAYTLFASYHPSEGFCIGENFPGINTRHIIPTKTGFVRLVDIHNADSSPSGSIISWDTADNLPDPKCNCQN